MAVKARPLTLAVAGILLNELSAFSDNTLALSFHDSSAKNPDPAPHSIANTAESYAAFASSLFLSMSLASFSGSTSNFSLNFSNIHFII